MYFFLILLESFYVNFNLLENYVKSTQKITGTHFGLVPALLLYLYAKFHGNLSFMRRLMKILVFGFRRGLGVHAASNLNQFGQFIFPMMIYISV